ncbi:MAG: enoyl-CoA hydratase-related protein [Gemmobacter sp.]
MADAVGYERRGGVAVLVIDNPPVNALGAAVRKGLAAGLERALADAAVQAVVILAAGRTFPAGADITEFGKPPADPWLPDLCDRIEASPKQVVAAIHGTALGGGLELALAAHTRIALSTARLGLPEVTLGILPGAGGTQRTPRLIGAEAALRLMISGKPVGAAEAQALGLIDGVVEDDLAGAAIALAEMLAAEGKPPRRSRDCTDGMRDPAAYVAVVAAARARHAHDRLPAPRRIVDCVEAAMLLPFEQGLEFERAAFEELVVTPESAGLRHAFFAERSAARMPEAKAAPRGEIRSVGIVGGGQTGGELALAFLGAGCSVTLLDPDTAMLERALERVVRLQEKAVAEGRLGADARAADWARLSGAVDPAEVADTDLVLATGGDGAALLAAAAQMRAGGILAHGGGWTDIEAMGRAAGRPADLLGLRLHPPAHVTRLAEITPGPETAPDAVAAVLALLRRMGRVAVRCGFGGGCISARLQAACRDAGILSLLAGASPAAVDRAMTEFGLPAGPFLSDDLAGHGADERPAAREPAPERALADRLRSLGRSGRAAGRGWYLWSASGDYSEDPEVLALVEAERAARGIAASVLTEEDLRLRCLAAMANEGARILAEGRALRGSDIDAVALFGFGFPRWEGGPMHWADRFGILQLRNLLRGLVPEAPGLWEPAPGLDAMALNGRRFSDPPML